MTPRYAGLVSRGLALLADLAILAFLIAGTDWVGRQVVRQMLPGSLVDPGRCVQAKGWWQIWAPLCRALPLLGPIAAYSLPPLYRGAFWTVIGQTPGMALFGLRVLRTDGRPLGPGTALVRLLGEFVCICTFGLGFLPVATSSRRQGLHDRVAGTVVVHDWLAAGRTPGEPLGPTR